VERRGEERRRQTERKCSAPQMAQMAQITSILEGGHWQLESGGPGIAGAWTFGIREREERGERRERERERERERGMINMRA
jgi:hypothetical protein